MANINQIKDLFSDDASIALTAHMDECMLVELEATLSQHRS